MVLAIDLARLSIAQIDLLAVTARKNDVRYRLSATRYSTDSLTNYDSQGRWCQLSIPLNSLQHGSTYFLWQAEIMASAIDSDGRRTRQMHLQTVTAREYGISNRFNSTLNSKDSLTSYNSQRRWCQLSIQHDSLQHRFTYTL
jgi:hypothetical protein